MNKIERLANKFAARVEFDDDGFIQNAQEVQNAIFEAACSEFSDRLPPENLIGSGNDDFNESDIGDWSGRENKAGRTMQTIYERSIEIAGEKNI